MNTIYKHNIGILLATLIVALFIPNLSVVHADDEEEEEDEYSDEVIPRYRIPAERYGWEAVESVHVSMMGEYDTSWHIPTWVTDLIEKFTKERNDIAHKEPCRTGSIWTIYRRTRYERQISKTERVIEDGRRGFYATFNDPGQWAYAMWAYFMQNKTIVYVDSEMRENHSTIGCTHKFVVLHTPSEYIRESINAFKNAPAFFLWDWEDYHLFERNCQHYNDWVLTGIDHSR